MEVEDQRWPKAFEESNYREITTKILRVFIFLEYEFSTLLVDIKAVLDDRRHFHLEGIVINWL